MNVPDNIHIGDIHQHFHHHPGQEINPDVLGKYLLNNSQRVLFPQHQRSNRSSENLLAWKSIVKF